MTECELERDRDQRGRERESHWVTAWLLKEGVLNTSIYRMKRKKPKKEALYRIVLISNTCVLFFVLSLLENTHGKSI